MTPRDRRSVHVHVRPAAPAPPGAPEERVAALRAAVALYLGIENEGEHPASVQLNAGARMEISTEEEIGMEKDFSFKHIDVQSLFLH